MDIAINSSTYGKVKHGCMPISPTFIPFSIQCLLRSSPVGSRREASRYEVHTGKQTSLKHLSMTRFPNTVAQAVEEALGGSARLGAGVHGGRAGPRRAPKGHGHYQGAGEKRENRGRGRKEKDEFNARIDYTIVCQKRQELQ